MTKGKWEVAFTKKREEDPDEQAPVEENNDGMLFSSHDSSLGGRAPTAASSDAEASGDQGARLEDGEALLSEGTKGADRFPSESLAEKEPSEQCWQSIFLGSRDTAQGGSGASVSPAEGPRLRLPLGLPAASEDAHNAPPALAKMTPSLNSMWTSLLMKSAPTPRSLLFCGATQGEGVSFISFHFSLFLALGLHLRVLYLDTDVEKRSPCPYLPALEEGRGLVSFLDEHVPLRSLVASTQFENLWALPAGDRKSSGRPEGFVYVKEALGELADFCQRHFDVAVFDGQPVLWSPATVAFARAVDRVLLVCRYGYSRREVSKLAIETLKDNEVNVAGVILNDRQYPVPRKLYRKLK